MKELRLYPDYFCWPTWVPYTDGLDNINPNELPISKDLAVCVISWGEYFDGFLDMDDPASSERMTVEEEEKFISDGRELAKRLSIELEGRYKVVFWPSLDDRKV